MYDVRKNLSRKKPRQKKQKKHWTNQKKYVIVYECCLQMQFSLFENSDAWLSLVERCVRDAEVAGSNPVASTTPPSYGGFVILSVFSKESGLTELEAYYNKFNEEKRLNSRHGQVEFITSMKYIRNYLEVTAVRTGKSKADIKLLDLGAGTGRYSIPLAEEGYDVTAVEPVRHNLGRLRQKSSLVRAFQGNALKLTRFDDARKHMTPHCMRDLPPSSGPYRENDTVNQEDTGCSFQRYPQSYLQCPEQ